MNLICPGMISALQTQRQKKDFSHTNISGNLYDNFAREDNNNFLFKRQVGSLSFYFIYFY